ncbi:MAG: SusC/RagA family TonB-linked outer membrane protein [Dysgonomonas sp.]
MERLKLTILCLFLGIGIAMSQTQSVSGLVVDEAGEPVIGATVAVKGTTVGTTTDLDGNFSLSVPNGTKNLTVSYLGYEEQTVPVAKVMKVTLKSTSTSLDEVVVTGMVAVDKRMFTGAADKLDADKVKLDGIADISRGLEGRSAGVSVQNISGTFGTAPKIRVRGATSIYGSSKPLWVVDGVIMENITDVDADALSSGDAVTLISSAIAGLNADDIESFDILKDGSATSIYGARAMAGVIVVTTKKGKAGVSQINYTGEFTMRLKPSYSEFNIMNSQEQMGVYKELQEKGWLNFSDTFRASNSGVYGKMYQLANQINPLTGQFTILNTPEARNAYLRQAEMRNTDWFDELFESNVMQQHSVSISSGTEKTSFYGSLSAMFDPGWYKQSSVKRYTGNLNAIHKILPNLSLNLITNASYRKQKAPGTLSQEVDPVSGSVSRNFDINPYSYAINTSRAMDPEEYYTRNYSKFNIFHELDNNNMELNVVDLKFQGELTWTVIPGLDLKALGAIKYSTTSQEHRIKDDANQALAYRAMGDATIRDRNPYLYQDPDNPYQLPITVLPEGGFFRRTDYKMEGYDFRASFNWRKDFKDKHYVNAFGGLELNSLERSNTFFNGIGMQYDLGELPFYMYEFFKKDLEQNTSYYDIAYSRSRMASFFAMLNYQYDRRYTLTGTFRYEGSNKLGKTKSARWLPTWNFSGRWDVSEEKFFESLKSVMSHLSLSASYSLTADGSLGGISNAKVLIRSYNPYRPFSSSKESGLYISSLGNDDLTYEKKHEFNLSLAAGFLNNRLNFEGAWFKRNNYDLIGRIYTPGIGGEIAKMANVAEMKSDGIEVTISSRNIVQKDFSWNTDFIFSHFSTEVTKLNTRDIAMNYVQGNGFTMVGRPHRGLYSFRFNGLNEDGFPTFINEDGNVTVGDINFQETQNLEKFLKYEGPAEPTYNGSLGNIFRYKGLSLNVFVTYAFGNKVRLDPVFSSSYDDLAATPKEFKNRWVMAGDENRTSVPVIPSNRQVQENGQGLRRAYNAYNYSTERIADGGFIRMKEISLTYDLPKKILPKEINKLSVKLQATNLFLIYADDKLNGQDPEFFQSGGVSAPVPKQFTFTVRLGL